ncbi:MAG: hypothetical protein L7U87_01950 [Chlamydiales bacterium]|nr:hypothetical protein [Chlamydiales bacterium]
MSIKPLDTSEGISSFFIPDNFEISGSLSHPNADPLHDQKLKLYLKLFYFKIPLATARTDENGKFQLKFKATKIPYREQELVIKVVEDKLKEPESFFNFSTEKELASIRISKKFSEKKVDYPNLQTELYEYEDDLPMLKHPEKNELRPQQWGISYYKSLLKAVFDEKIKDLYFTFFDDEASLEKLVKYYGGNDDIKHSMEKTIEMIFNGIFPCDPLKTDKEGVYLVEIKWDGYEKKPTPVIPNTKLYFTLENETPEIVELHLEYPPHESVVYKPEDEDFLKALYHFNCAAFYKGEITKHLAIGHLASEQYAMAVFRHLKDHPIGRLLKPHLREVMEINHLGKSAIFGPEGILARGPLTVDAIRDYLRDDLRKIDYSNFNPRKVLYPGHRFAVAANKYWEILEKTIDLFFKENDINPTNPEVKKQWYQVYYMSKALVEHSVEHRDSDDKDYEALLDKNEADDPSFPGRKYFNGELKTVRPITENKAEPTIEDIQRLKLFCMHALFQVTFWHWWIHSSQKTWGIQLQLASLAPQENGDLPFGDTRKKDAKHQLSISKSLTDFDRGVLIENPNGDIYPALITELRRNKEFFMSLGLNVNELPYGTII